MQPGAGCLGGWWGSTALRELEALVQIKEGARWEWGVVKATLCHQSHSYREKYLSWALRKALLLGATRTMHQGQL